MATDGMILVLHPVRNACSSHGASTAHGARMREGVLLPTQSYTQASCNLSIVPHPLSRTTQPSHACHQRRTPVQRQTVALIFELTCHALRSITAGKQKNSQWTGNISNTKESVSWKALNKNLYNFLLDCSCS